jgi:hypothetical protein
VEVVALMNGVVLVVALVVALVVERSAGLDVGDA